MTQWDHTTTADEVVAGMDLTRKVMLVTGASGGIGLESARVLAAQGARVCLAARNHEALAEARQSIEDQYPDALVETGVLDLADPASIQRFAREFGERHSHLDVLINNAGVMACGESYTDYGYEWQFGVNHIGHFLLTRELLPLLQQSGAARVVSLSSGGHKVSPVVFDDINFDNRPYDKWEAYGQAKTANALFAVALNKRHAPAVTANAVHPGAIGTTDLARHMSRADIEQVTQQLSDDTGFAFKSVGAGAATSVWAATAPELEGRGGLYLEDCGLGQPTNEKMAEKGYFEHALDPDAAERLWQLSEDIVERIT